MHVRWSGRHRHPQPIPGCGLIVAPRGDRVVGQLGELPISEIDAVVLILGNG
ncbi:hypothetical protein D3C71_2146520 [compost metagenome]